MDLNKYKKNIGFLWQFSLDDFKNKYSGSFMGVTWAFVQPLMTILIYWFVFQIGFKSQPVSNYPYILWLVSGIIPWFFISEGIVSVTTSLSEYSYLVKKIVFDINILPLVKVLSCFLVQIFLIIITQILFIVWGFYPDVYYLQIFYYLLYATVLLIGLGYCTSALYVFFKDLIQIVNIIMQIIFWVTPIVWNFDIMPESVKKVLEFNPVYYIINGYRDCFINKKFFWENLNMGAYYWIVALLMLVIGKKVFKKTKIHFADVL